MIAAIAWVTGPYIITRCADTIGMRQREREADEDELWMASEALAGMTIVATLAVVGWITVRVVAFGEFGG